MDRCGMKTTVPAFTPLPSKTVGSSVVRRLEGQFEQRYKEFGGPLATFGRTS